MLAPHVAADASGMPLLVNKVDPNDPKNLLTKQYPAVPIGWTSWWPSEGPTVCFPSGDGKLPTGNDTSGFNICVAYTDDFSHDGGFKPALNVPTVAVDPQIGWEVQKFVIAWTLAYIPANSQTNWVDMMRIYQLGPNVDPAFDDRIEWEDPVSEQLYYAKSYGKECLFGPSTATDKASCEMAGGSPTGGKWVEKGIAARVLEWANFLTSNGYAADPAYASTGGFNAYGRFMVKRMADGTPLVRFDPTMQAFNGTGVGGPAPATCDTDTGVAEDCDGTVLDYQAKGTGATGTFCGVTSYRALGCKAPLTLTSNRYAVALAAYKSVPDYLWEVMLTYKLTDSKQLGLSP
jgi:hypothetical protein